MSDLLWAKIHDLTGRLSAMESFFHREHPGWNTIPEAEKPTPNAELKPWEKPTVQADGQVTPPPPIGTHPDDRRGDISPDGDPWAPMTITEGGPATPVDA